ncbi:hypothetical protein GGS26DRAFT_540597 [Hypomontagnella submonticulosa]|nr:hypothetical protein GGS26DRAFT_540597 [Hypomontagnella submonticulosa]
MGHHGVVELLLTSNGINPDLKGELDRSPLRLTTSNGHKEIVKLLLIKSSVD